MAVTAQASRGSYLKVKFSAGVKSITGLLDATFTQTMETIDVTELSSTRRQFIPGVLTGTISGNLYYDQSDADFALFEQAIAQGYATGTTYFEIEVGWTNSAAYTAKAVFTEWTVTTAQQDVVRVSFSAQIHDTVTIT
jgi:hypothetical protein